MKKILLGLVLSFFVSASANANMVIDDFDTMQIANGPDVGLSPLGDFASDADREFNSTGGFAGINTDPSLLTFGAFLGTFEVIWSNFDTGILLPPVNGSPANISFALQGVNWTGPTDLVLDLEIVDLTLTAQTVSVVIPDGTLDGSFDFFFTDFNLVDLGQIDQIGLSTNGPVTGNFMADALVVTPEPSSLVLCGIGLVAMGGYGYRRRRKSVNANATSA